MLHVVRIHTEVRDPIAVAACAVEKQQQIRLREWMPQALHLRSARIAKNCPEMRQNRVIVQA